ncbi:hypothetical protein AQUCO_02500194v1 [Aquilegia coerulea]|uniref:Uncharacterized protein n=1 Tax=Aquilegia coerulea TaxID=218851 RepID=A0A2G5D9Y9_AQUCA|nr:hypothetical protein AQUCO_02500194v1 [Aquilegia coerulea]
MVTVSPWSSSSDSSSSSSDSFTKRSLEIEASWNRHIRRMNLMMQMGLMMMLAYLIEREREEEEEEERAHSLEMRELRSRKRNHSSFPNYYEKNKRKKTPIEISNSSEPFPTHLRPTPEECRLVRDSLLSLHGFPKEFAKYSKIRSGLGISSNTSEPNENEAEVVEEAKGECVGWFGEYSFISEYY